MPISSGVFSRALQASRSPIKPLLLGGKLVVGVGNIYASEVLFASRIAPTAVANSISTRRRLYQSIREILAPAVERGGTTLRDFSSADGMPGHFSYKLRCMGATARSRMRCGNPIALLRQGQRSTYYCPYCQKV